MIISRTYVSVVDHEKLHEVVPPRDGLKKVYSRGHQHCVPVRGEKYSRRRKPFLPDVRNLSVEGNKVVEKV